MDTQKLLECITRAQRDYVVGQAPQPLFDRMLTDLLELTGSEYGFIGEILETDGGEPYLKTYAITNIAWDDATRRFYDENAPSGMEFFNLKSLFGQVMVTRAPVLANAPATDPRRCGLPEGHPSLDAFLGAPFFHGGEFVGMVGVANREGGYDDALVEWLQPLLTTCGGIIAAHRAWRERLRIDATLREARDMAEAANAAKTRFLANMSHELRTPLNAIIGFSGRLLKAERPPREEQFLSRVRENGIHLLSLVNDLLDVARIEAGEMEVVDEDVSLRELVDGVVTDLAGQARDGVTLEARLPDGELLVRGDPIRLKQVVVNLVANALKFTERGEVVVEVQLDDAGGVGHLAVRDTGIGMSPMELARVFEPFQQADDTSSRAHDGVGLGLALCRSFAELMGHTVEAESAPGEGSTFRVSFQR